MLEYDYKQIKKFNEDGIVFEDGTRIKFVECRENWAKSRGVEYEDTLCVADRNISAEIPYFVFYSKKKIKILFKKSVLPWSNLCKKNFLKIQIGLNRFGYSSYDCS